MKLLETKANLQDYDYAIFKDIIPTVKAIKNNKLVFI